MNIIWAVASHKGRIRTNNEDSVYPRTSGRSSGPVVLMVADGMGGHVAGEVASRLAVEAAADESAGAEARVHTANRAILEAVEEEPSLAGMGTTLTLVEFDPPEFLHFAHIGDSRAYLLRAGELGRLTTDHTVMEEYLKAGSISPAEVANHPQRSMLTRALGMTPDIEVETFDLAAVAGDRILLCSDGVTSMLDEDDVERHLSAATAEEAAWALVEEANRAGGHDNITAVVFDLLEAEET